MRSRPIAPAGLLAYFVGFASSFAVVLQGFVAAFAGPAMAALQAPQKREAAVVCSSSPAAG